MRRLNRIGWFILLWILMVMGLGQVQAQDPSEPQYMAWIRDPQAYFTFLPNDEYWEYRANAMTAWNILVEDNGSGQFSDNSFLLGFRVRNGAPIRDHLPTPNNGEYEMGVLSSEQMEERGYDSWKDLGANGVAYSK